MEKAKRKKLEAAGYRVTTVEEFLDLSSEEAELIELKLRLGEKLRAVRQQLHLTQSELAKRLHTSQPRVAKMEAGDPSVSIDLLVRGLLAAGVNRRDIGRAVAR